MSKINWCTCNGHRSKDFIKVTSLYSESFVPSGRTLEYKSLTEYEEGRFLYFTGVCNKCFGYMRSGTSLPYNRSNYGFIECVWQEFLKYRPFPGLATRMHWYFEQDILPSEDKYDLFVELFHQEDRELVQAWLDENKPSADIDVSTELTSVDTIQMLRNIFDLNNIPTTEKEIQSVIGVYEGHGYELAIAYGELYQVDINLGEDEKCGEVFRVNLSAAVEQAYSWLDSLYYEENDDCTNALYISQIKETRDLVDSLIQRMEPAEMCNYIIPDENQLQSWSK